MIERRHHATAAWQWHEETLAAGPGPEAADALADWFDQIDKY